MNMRKIISLVLALVLVCSIIPFAAYAEGEVNSVTFDFSTQTKKNEEIASSNALSFFASCASDASYLTAATTKKIFNGNGSGGKWPNTAGFLKTGNSSTKGELSLTFTEKVAKVELVCYAWNDGKTDTIAVNGGTARTAPYAGSFDTMTFEITESETVQIVANKRTFIQSITVTFAGGETGGEDPTPEVPEQPEQPVVPETLAEQIAEANKLNNGEHLPYESTITGTIIDEPKASDYNEGQYKFTVSDGTNTILCYYTPVADGVVPAKGDTATVVGKLTAYAGTAQFDETAIAVVVNNVPEQPENPEQPGTGDEAPETSGVSIVAMAVLSVLSGSALVLLKKKEF